MQALGIGQLAKRAGVGIDTVRYYERNGFSRRDRGSRPATVAMGILSSIGYALFVARRASDSR
jgi:hypothetical protein